jgi:hypothetical protein
LVSQVLTCTPTGIIAGDESKVHVGVVGSYLGGVHAGDHNIGLEYTITGEKKDDYVISNGSTQTLLGTIAPRAVTVTSDSDTKQFDNSPLTKNSYKVTSGSFVGHEGFESISIIGQCTDAGSFKNSFERDEEKVVYSVKQNTNDSDYAFTFIEGDLIITPVTVTVPTGGSLKYTGTVLEAAVAKSDWYTFLETEGSTVRESQLGDYIVKISLLYNHDAIVNVKWSDDSTEVKNVAWHIIVSALNPNCFSLKEETVFYNGQPHTDMVLYTPSGGVHYTEGTDYRVDYTADTTNKGDKTATIVGINGYAGSTPIVLEFEVLPLPITVTFDEHQAFLYDGNEHTPVFEHSDIMEGDAVTFSLDFKD